eukprot:1121991-Rhodomonas_salina.1
MCPGSINTATLQRSISVDKLAKADFSPSYKSKPRDVSLDFDVAVDDSNHLNDRFCVLSHRFRSPLRTYSDAAAKSSMRRRSMETMPTSSFSSSGSPSSPGSSNAVPVRSRGSSDDFATNSSARRRSMETMPTVDRSGSAPSSLTGSRTGRRRTFRREDTPAQLALGPAATTALSLAGGAMTPPRAGASPRRQRLSSIAVQVHPSFSAAPFEHRRQSAIDSPDSVVGNSVSSLGSFDESSHSRRSDSKAAGSLYVSAKKKTRTRDLFANSFKRGWGEGGTFFERWML